MVAQVKQLENGSGIAFSKEILNFAGVCLNDTLEVELVNDAIVLKKTRKHLTLEERAEQFGGKLGPYEEFDWGEPVGRERW